MSTIKRMLLITCLIRATTVLSQSVHHLTLVESHAPITKVLRDIQHLTGYLYSIDSISISQSQPITVSLKDATLSQLLDSCLKDQPLYLQVIGHSINVRLGGSVSGRVVDGQGSSIAAATVRSEGLHYSDATKTDDHGQFHLRFPGSEIVILVSCIGYESRQYRVSGGQELLIQLRTRPSELQHVIVSNGFDNEVMERSTGSFDHVGRELIGRSASPGIVDRMDGVTGGLLVNTNVQAGGTNQSGFTIRGRSTIFSNPNPLVVVDNFPYDGDINNINPEDVETITVLKDAAAASIWGTRAANGVVVIKTRQGRYDQKPRLSFTTSLTVGQRPNLHYTPVLSSADYVGMEEWLFTQGFYDGKIGSLSHPGLSPVVEILLQQREGLLSAADTTAQLNMLRGQDTRRDLLHYFYQPQVNQQYWLGLDGGSASDRYAISAGLDKDMASLVRNGYNRITVNGNNSYRLIPQKLELSTGVAFTASTTDANNSGSGGSVYPYEKLAGAGGNALAVPYQLRQDYVDTVGGGRLLDWHYRPLDELHNASNVTRLTDWRLNAGLYYTILKGLQLQALYQYGQGSSDQQDAQSLQTYYARNLINEYTQVDQAGELVYPIPVGGILDELVSSYQSHNGRLQADYHHSFGADHDLRLLAGTEIQDVEGRIQQSRLYGYNSASQGSLPVSSYTTLYPQYSSPGTQATIPDPNENLSSHDHYWSYYANGGYQYLGRYTVTASAREDQSNLFGVNINHKTIPLWSAGAAWEVSREEFFPKNWLSLLRLRVTDGYNGNAYKAVSAYTTATSVNSTAFNTTGIGAGFINTYGAAAAEITNPPNPNLRWEQVHVVNAGVDFSSKNNRVEGSLDYYRKAGQYLIGQAGLDPTSGNVQYTGNVANMVTQGVELSLHNQVNIGPVFWKSDLLFNYVQDKVTRYMVKPGTILSFFNAAVINPLAGRPLYSVYALKWAGLDPKTGGPVGWLNGKTSENYTSITGSSDFSTLLYKGPVNPPLFGSWRNSFSWGRWGVSFMLVYKFGDYFSRSPIQYFTLFNGNSRGHPDYDRRWQQPGDELHTYVPSMTYPANSTRDYFYASSEVLVEKGDLIRLQDVQVFYDLPKKAMPKLPVQALRFYLYANHIALLWTANRQGIDPDAQTSLPAPRTVALGCKMQF